MSEDRNHTDPDALEEKPVIQIDAYGVKTRFTASDLDASSPATWREAWERVNRHLKRIAVGIPGLVDDTVSGIRSLIRGIAGIPSAIKTRIEGAHIEADRRELSAQTALECGSTPPPSPGEAIAAIEEIINRHQSKARLVIFPMPDGRICMIAVAHDCPLSDEEIVALATQSQESSGTPFILRIYRKGKDVHAEVQLAPSEDAPRHIQGEPKKGLPEPKMDSRERQLRPPRSGPPAS